MGKYQKNIEAARRITVMQYLETYHPGELVRKTDREYCTRTHDSLIITPANGFFHWFSRNVGGNNAIDYLTKVEGMDFVSAVRLLNEMAPVAASFQPAKAAPVKPHEPRPFTLPTPDRNVEAVAAYLMHRGISPKVLRYCVGSGILYQTTRGNYRNCVFVGKDEGGVPRSAFQRGCQGTYRGDVTGSQKKYGFLMQAENPDCDTVELYEAPIDANLTEKDAQAMCQAEGLLSPLYAFTGRGGCWFCPNASMRELRHLYNAHPDLWQLLLELQDAPNKATERFNRSYTLHDLDLRFCLEGEQLSLFSYGER